ncbi:DUF192 domain-containing protein [Rhodobacterales bacterium HKCCE3408]|nr:DUF192 domain-containing protein [Rhodobacterales bacterium HKCCE3408]
MRALTLSLALLTLPQLAAAACTDGRVEIRGDFGTARFRVEIADDAAERGLGLMNREELAAGAGMLFVYQVEEEVGFWMQNTLIPLDMIFFDATGTVVKVHENAIPLDRTVIRSDFPTQYVLEINGGLASQIGIEPGAELRHPAVDQDGAAWPCE